MVRSTAFFEITAGLFRQGFEQMDLSNAPGFFPSFPEGCCSWATWTMGHYFKFEMNLDPIELIGRRTDATGSGSHSWLKVNGLHIDITSDQFADSNAPVIVTESSIWHRTWTEIQTDEIREIDIHDGAATSSQLKPSEIYNELSSYVSNHLSH